MRNPIVSIVIPTYKRPDMIVRAVDSALNQTYAQIEVIVVDDNDPSSPDRKKTETIMAQYKGNPRVQYILHEKNKNGSAARNTGWRQAKGEYITFLDDDDEISKDKIKLQVNCLESLDESWGACYSGYHIVKPNGVVHKASDFKSGDVYLQALMRTMFMGSGSNLLLRKTVVDKVNGYDESFKRNQDIEFMARVFEKHKLACIKDDLLTIHQDRATTHRSYEASDEISKYYLLRFDSRINTLSPKERKRVIEVISLERFRNALMYRKLKTGTIKYFV